MTRLPWLVSAMIVLAGCQQPTALAPQARGSEDLRAASRASKEVLVKLAPGAAVGPMGIRRARGPLAKLGWQVVEAEGDVTATLARLERTPGVLAAEPNTLMKLHAGPRFDDPELPRREKAHARVQIEQAWALTTGAPEVVVAVLDTGVDAAHPDLKNRLVPGYNAIDQSADVRDDHSHGTACIGLVAAEAGNGVGVAGFAPNVRVMPVRVLNRRGVGPLEWAAAGIVWAADHGADVVTMSFGEDAPSQVLQDAVEYARKKNVVLIASMGNDGEEKLHWPAACPGVLAVGATYDDDRPALFTTEGEHVGIAAPGSRVYTTYPTYPITDPMFGKRDVNYGYFSGTSASGPIVGAVAALLRSKHPSLGEAEIRARLRKTADDVGPAGWDKYSGDGRVNAWRALTER